MARLQHVGAFPSEEQILTNAPVILSSARGGLRLGAETAFLTGATASRGD